VVSGVAQLASPGQTDPFSGTPDYLIQFLRTLSLLLTLAGFVALHLVFQAGGIAAVRGWTGFRAAVLGQGALLASAVASLVAGAPTLGFLLSPGPSYSCSGWRCLASPPTGRRSCRGGAPTWWALWPWVS
jgi:hypothetical protein